MPLLSIIIPIYNSESTLKKCIDSILAQDFTDYELILISDGSSDNSNDIAMKYSNLFSQISFYDLTHRGVSAIRNFGIEQAKGNYITFVDADDYLEPCTYKQVMDAIITTNTNIIIYGYFTEKDNITTPIVYTSTQISVCNNILQQLFIEDSIGGFVWNKVYSKNAISNIRFNPHISICEDLLFNFEILSNKANQCYCLPIPLYHYYQGNSVTSSQNYFDSNLKFKYKPAFDLIINKIEDTSLKSAVMDKYTSILQYSMYCLLHNPYLDTFQIKLMKKELKNNVKHVFQSARYSKQDKIHYLFFTFLPRLYRLHFYPFNI